MTRRYQRTATAITSRGNQYPAGAEEPSVELITATASRPAARSPNATEPLEIVLTPIFIRTRIPHLENPQRAIVGIAIAHLEPDHLPLALGRGHNFRLAESTTTAVLIIIVWLVGWTTLGA